MNLSSSAAVSTRHLHLASRIFHGVVDQVRNRGAHLVEIAHDRYRRTGLVLERLRREPMQRSRSRQAFLNDAVQIDDARCSLRWLVDPIRPVRSTCSMVASRRSLSSTMVR